MCTPTQVSALLLIKGILYLCTCEHCEEWFWGWGWILISCHCAKACTRVLNRLSADCHAITVLLCKIVCIILWMVWVGVCVYAVSAWAGSILVIEELACVWGWVSLVCKVICRVHKMHRVTSECWPLLALEFGSECSLTYMYVYVHTCLHSHRWFIVILYRVW